MGLFILEPRFRGCGWGPRLWHDRRDRLLARLSSPATIGLDAVEDLLEGRRRAGIRAQFLLFGE